MQIYNIGTNEKISIKKLALNLAKMLNKKIIIKKSALQKGGTLIRLPNILKIKKIGFKQKFNIIKGLKETLKFYY